MKLFLLKIQYTSDTFFDEEDRNMTITVHSIIKRFDFTFNQINRVDY